MKSLNSFNTSFLRSERGGIAILTLLLLMFMAIPLAIPMAQKMSQMSLISDVAYSNI